MPHTILWITEAAAGAVAVAVARAGTDARARPRTDRAPGEQGRNESAEPDAARRVRTAKPPPALRATDGRGGVTGTRIAG